jgi:threonine/homoserine/homoserine lactone efflux protein
MENIMLIIDQSKYMLFLATTLLICITPGPDMLYIIATSIRAGAKAGIIAAFGMAIGMSFYTLTISAGLAMFFNNAANAFFILQLCGGFYLIWIGVQALREKNLSIQNRFYQEQQSNIIIFRQAALTNLMNPKIAIFYIAYLPQFTNEALGNMNAQLLVLGFSFLIVGLIIDSIIGLLSGKARNIFIYKPEVVKIMHFLAGSVYIGLGIRMFFI